ncbi:MAG: VOC family protein [Blastocatellia bacterium]
MEVSKHDPGMFCWVELGTSDQAGAKTFYSDLFGWTIDDKPMGPDEVYTIMQLNGKDAAAMYTLRPDLQQGVPPHWMTYICVENADQAAEAITAAGGTVMMGPFDVSTMGRMAVAQDPTGAHFSVWQPGDNNGVGVKNEANAFCWAELATRDTAAAEAFYTRVFGWDPVHKEFGPIKYTEYYPHGRAAEGMAVGGMMDMPPELGDVPAHWAVYFAVADCDDAAARAKALGATVLAGPEDIPGVGRFAVMQDPQGAVFSTIKLDFA